MNKRHLTLIPLCIMLLSAGPSISDDVVRDPSIYYVPGKNYQIKNFAILNGIAHDTAFYGKNSIVTFEICLNKITDSKPIYLSNEKFEQSGNVNPTKFYLDGRLGKEFQRVILSYENFDAYIRAKTDYFVMYDDEKLFTFNANRFMTSGETFNYSFDEFKKTVKFTFPTSRQLIVDGKFQYMNDYIEVSFTGLDKFINYYYGRLANEYLLVKYYNDYDKYLSPELKKAYFGDDDLMYIFLFVNDYTQFEKEVASDHRGEGFIFNANKKFKEYSRFEFSQNENLYHTYEDGKMRKLSSKSDPWLKTHEYNPSKSVTFCMDDISHQRLYNNLCKADIDFRIAFGMESSNWLTTTFRLTPQYDYFYNHLDGYSMEGTFNNNEIKGFDKEYA